MGGAWRFIDVPSCHLSPLRTSARTMPEMLLGGTGLQATKGQGRILRSLRLTADIVYSVSMCGLSDMTQRFNSVAYDAGLVDGSERQPRLLRLTLLRTQIRVSRDQRPRAPS